MLFRQHHSFVRAEKMCNFPPLIYIYIYILLELFLAEFISLEWEWTNEMSSSKNVHVHSLQSNRPYPKRTVSKRRVVRF